MSLSWSSRCSTGTPDAAGPAGEPYPTPSGRLCGGLRPTSLCLVTQTRESSPAPLRLLFVCTANISRSPFAERRAAHLLKNAGLDGHGITVASAGIPGHPGRDMDPEMAKQLRARGGEPDGHVSRSLTTDMLALADLVITFELAQRLRILESHPGWTHKLFGLNQLVDALERTPPTSTGVRLVDDAHRASAPDSMTWDVPDPYGRGRAAARKAADEIDETLAVIVRATTGRLA